MIQTMTHQSVTFWFDFANSIWPLQQCFSLILKQVWHIYIYKVQYKFDLLPAKVLYIVWVTETHATIAHEDQYPQPDAYIQNIPYK